MSRPLISMVLIARDEEQNIQPCFESFWDAVDEVVLCDTGSTDKTVDRARWFAKRKKEPHKLIVTPFDWCDDFSAARRHADQAATGRWLAWCDLDDTIHGMSALRQLAEQATPDVDGFFCQYEYARDEHGTVISELWRERLVRAGVGQWQFPVHECKVAPGAKLAQVPPHVARWVHRREQVGDYPERNLRILRQWDEREPDTPRVVGYIATELIGLKRRDDAIAEFERYLQLPMESPDNFAQASRYLCALMCEADRTAEAQQRALAALAVNPGWCDTYMTLAEIAHGTGHPKDALVWVDHAERLGKPATHLILNPQQYTTHLTAVKAASLYDLGRLDEAIDQAKAALTVSPGYMGLDERLPGWMAELERKRTAGALANLARVAVGNDEPEKALALLKAAPCFVQDEPEIVQARGMVARHLAAATRRLYDGEGLPQVGDTPSGQFLVRQLRVQLEQEEIAA